MQRPITTDGMRFTAPPVATDAAGPAPQLMWIAIADLVVDHGYQRPVTSTGRANVARIAANFRWSMFSPVIVAPVTGGRYAIVDGQHRATAAALVGHDKVPCQVILATSREQAIAFTAINGTVTRMHKMQIHKAAIAAGDPAALEIARVARRANVKVLAYPKSELRQEPGETMAVGALGEAIARHGADAVVVALRCIRETPNDLRGSLLGPVIRALALIVAELQAAGRSDADIIGDFGKINIIREYDKARLAIRPQGIGIWGALVERLRARLEGLK